MAKKSGFKKFILTVLTVILSLVFVAGIAGLCVYNFVIIPKYNQYINTGEKQGEKLSNKDIITFAKLVTDKQLITNLSNLDKQTAKDVLSAMIELEEEIEAEATPTPTSTHAPITKPFIQFTPVKKDTVFTKVEAVHKVVPTPVPTPAPTPFTPPKIPDEIQVSKEQQTAYDRIMAAASKEEIQTGMAIIAKVNMSTVNAYNSSGDTAGLKKYIKSVLSSGEISTALKLYKKYKHLL